MTQNPEIEPGTPAPLSSTEVTDLAALDQGTYSQLRTVRNEARLELDGTWHQISPRYVVSQVLQNLIFVAFVLAAALVLALVLDQTWVWIPAGVIVLITLITLVILPRQAKAIGYMLRDDDIVFRKGILWQLSLIHI